MRTARLVEWIQVTCAIIGQVFPGPFIPERRIARWDCI